MDITGANGVKTVLVTGIGGHPGQGILRNLRSYGRPLRLVGTDVNRATAGHHYCDAFHQVPYSYDAAYPAEISAVVAEESVDLIIPATDYETVHLAAMRDRLPILIASSVAFTRLCLDKLATHDGFRERGIAFVESVVPSCYGGQWDNIVVKPREGRGSRGVHFDPVNWQEFDDSNIVQRRLFGPELSTAFYVDRSGELLGEITVERTLHAGFTLRASVTTAYRSDIEAIIRQIVREYWVRGPCNIQSIATTEGPIPFELNARYSAISSFISQFGFRDVHYAVDEYLFATRPAPPVLATGFVQRTLFDIVYLHQTEDDLTSGPARSHVF